MKWRRPPRRRRDALSLLQFLFLEPADDEESLPCGKPCDLLSLDEEGGSLALLRSGDPQVAEEEPTVWFVLVRVMKVGHPQTMPDGLWGLQTEGPAVGRVLVSVSLI